MRLPHRPTQRERAGEHDGGAEPLRRASGDQRTDAQGERARHRAGEKEREPREEDALSTIEIAHVAGGEHEAREGEGVRIDHPLQPGRPRARGGADGRERDVDDRDIELNEEETTAGGDEREPLSARGVVQHVAGTSDRRTNGRPAARGTMARESSARHRNARDVPTGTAATAMATVVGARPPRCVLRAWHS